MKSGITEQELMRLVATASTPEVCECGNAVFEQAHIFRKISSIASPTGQELVVPIPVFVCMACGKALDDMLPDTFKLSKKKDETTSSAQADGDSRSSEQPSISKGGLTLV